MGMDLSVQSAYPLNNQQVIDNFSAALVEPVFGYKTRFILKTIAGLFLLAFVIVLIYYQDTFDLSSLFPMMILLPTFFIYIIIYHLIFNGVRTIGMVYLTIDNNEVYISDSITQKEHVIHKYSHMIIVPIFGGYRNSKTWYTYLLIGKSINQEIFCFHIRRKYFDKNKFIGTKKRKLKKGDLFGFLDSTYINYKIERRFRRLPPEYLTIALQQKNIR